MSQPTSFTLSVNDDNDDGTTPEVDVDYSHFQSFENRSEYISEHHTLEARDKLGLYRTFPKTSGNFRGTAKVSAKLTKDFDVTGIDATTLVAPAIAEVSFSFPVGLTDAQKTEFRMRLAALLSTESIMLPLTSQLMV